MQPTDELEQPIDTTVPAAAYAGNAAVTETVTETESTGDARVDAQLRVLEQLSSTPINEHVPILESVHRALSDVLATIDTDNSKDAATLGGAATSGAVADSGGTDPGDTADFASPDADEPGTSTAPQPGSAPARIR
ncbi:MAG: hypothetical protein DLM55_01180 [Acidimicrobiales bacterium]|nr:MAG: hypothetical protein DLM55_01180 [Acidimicrobiales bacterium]